MIEKISDSETYVTMDLELPISVKNALTEWSKARGFLTLEDGVINKTS